MSTFISKMSSLGILSEHRLEQFYPRVRDREDISVLRDPESDVIILSRSDHVSDRYYAERVEKNSYEVHGVEIATPKLEDNIRRREDFGGYIRMKRWLDFGCGLGGMLDEMAAEARWAAGLEPNRERAEVVAGKGHHVIHALSEIEAASLDVVTMFHVLEHLVDPLSVLSELRTRLKPGGVMLIEVPHGRDALFTLYDCEAFKKFTFWSEHLILHTRQSLEILLKSAGFTKVEIVGQQRYPLANHLYWLSHEQPGGHDIWRFLSSSRLTMEYEASLSKIDRTDTLIAVVST